jgi:hypothetical protein
MSSAILASQRVVVRDSARDTFLTLTDATATSPVSRTIDGVNFSNPPTGTNPGGWSARMFPHINVLWSRPVYASAGVWWNGEPDTIGNIATAGSLFPGYVYGHFYAGKKMLVNGNRLWDVIAK